MCLRWSFTEKVDVERLYGPRERGLMHSYHNVAELRQFRGAFAGQNALSTHGASTQSESR
jgi:hypothetical protein